MLGNKSRLTCKFVKIQIFKALTRTVLTCGCENTLSLKKRPSEHFERNDLKRIFGQARENGMWIIKYNEEI